MLESFRWFPFDQAHYQARYVNLMTKHNKMLWCEFWSEHDVRKIIFHWLHDSTHDSRQCVFVVIMLTNKLIEFWSGLFFPFDLFYVSKCQMPCVVYDHNWLNILCVSKCQMPYMVYDQCWCIQRMLNQKWIQIQIWNSHAFSKLYCFAILFIK